MWTSLIGHAFLDAYDHFQNDSYLQVAVSACEHILRDLETYRRRRFAFASAIFPTQNKQVHNANTLGASLLARTYSYTAERILPGFGGEGDSIHGPVTRGPTHPGITAKRRISTGSTTSIQPMCWIPSSTTRTAQATIASKQNLMSGYKYWKNTFFLPDGTPQILQPQNIADRHPVLFPGNRHACLLPRPRSGKLAAGAEGGQMDDRAHAGSHRLFLLSPVFAMAGQQNPHAALGTGDHALRARRTLQTVVELTGPLAVKKKVLIIVENLPVPFDTRVWKEASSLHQNGYEVTVLCPAGKGYEQRARSYRWDSHLPASHARRKAIALRLSLGIRLGAILGILLHLVDLSAARISCDSGL